MLPSNSVFPSNHLTKVHVITPLAGRVHAILIVLSLASDSTSLISRGGSGPIIRRQYYLNNQNNKQ